MKKTKRIVYILIFALGFTYIAGMSIPTSPSVVFYRENTSDVLAYFPLQGNQTFTHTYTHSIHLSDVKETYEVIGENEFALRELVYEDTSIGMPSNAEEGETFSFENGKYRIQGMNRVFSEISMRLGIESPTNRISIGDQEVLLQDTLEPGSWVTMKVSKLTGWQRLKGVNLDDPS